MIVQKDFIVFVFPDFRILVDFFQLFQKLSGFVPGNIQHGITEQMDNAALHYCAREDGSSAFFKAADTIHGDETVVFHTILSPEAEHVRALPDIVF